MAKSGGGGGGLVLVVLLLALGVGGAWNYRRNLDAEAAEKPRPYRTLDDAEIAQLIEAYRGEIADWEARAAGARGRSGGVREGAHLDDRIREFERLQSAGMKERAVGDALVTRRIELERLEEEQRLRSGSEDVIALHLRRLLTL
jgi:hypothetical protein